MTPTGPAQGPRWRRRKKKRASTPKRRVATERGTPEDLVQDPGDLAVQVGALALHTDDLSAWLDEVGRSGTDLQQEVLARLDTMVQSLTAVLEG